MSYPLAMALVLALAGRGYADAPVASPDETTATTQPAPLNRNVALLLSTGGSLVSIGLLVAPSDTARWIGAASLLVTPSLGEWYAHKFLTPGLALRLGAMTATVAYSAARGTCNDKPEVCISGWDYVVGLSALATFGAGVVWDIATARSTVDQRNQALHRPAIVPAVLTSPKGPMMGLGIRGAFWVMRELA